MEMSVYNISVQRCFLNLLIQFLPLHSDVFTASVLYLANTFLSPLPAKKDGNDTEKMFEQFS